MERKWYHFPLQGLTWLLGWVYICSFLLVFNILANGYWLIRMTLSGKLLEMLRWKREIQKSMTSLRKVIEEVSKFTYGFDGLIHSDDVPPDELKWYHMWPTWIPLIIVYLYRGRHDNCDGSETAARWLLRSLIKNRGEAYKCHVKYRKVIYSPYIPKNLKRVHYFTVATFDSNCELYNHNNPMTISNGVIKEESKDDLAVRYLKGDKRYVWIRW